MPKKNIAQTVEEIAEPIVEEAGCELVGVDFVKEGSNWFLRVYIDKPEGVSLDDCEKVSRPLNSKLDELNPISQPYYLEVSSPGVERPLKKPRDFEKAVGSQVEIRLYTAIDNTKRFEGELMSYDGNKVVISTESGIIHEFKMEQIAKAKKIFNFDFGGK